MMNINAVTASFGQIIEGSVKPNTQLPVVKLDGRRFKSMGSATSEIDGETYTMKAYKTTQVERVSTQQNLIADQNIKGDTLVRFFNGDNQISCDVFTNRPETAVGSWLVSNISKTHNQSKSRTNFLPDAQALVTKLEIKA